ncbi:MAG TPA: thiamine-phosphate kinase [Bacteroidia bacterium]|nr:thiamine-phosphate kinase [Bacteroidia bacterium]
MISESKAPVSIEQLGEFGLIKHLTRPFTTVQKSTLKSVGDDAAVIDTGNGKVTLVTTDMLLEGIHFDLMYMPLKHLGYKAVAVNISDICAMNGEARQITVSIGLSSKYTLAAVEELYDGIRAASKNYNVDLVGGDTTSSKQGLILSITAIGEAVKEKVVYRSGAKEGDLLCVSGDLGAAYMGYQLLEREKRVFLETPKVQPDLAGFDYVLERQLKPEARVDILALLSKTGVLPTAMIDISDGLASEIFHLCEQSGVGMNVYEEKIPIDSVTYNTAREFNLDPTMCALSGGEDYELLFTISQADFEKVKDISEISIIGHCTAKDSGKYLISKSGNVHPIQAQGWNHFNQTTPE